MNRIRLLLAVLPTMAACEPAPEAPALNSQQRADAEGDAYYAADPCGWLERTPQGFRVAHFAPPGDCMAMEPAEVMHGIWYDGFEERGFVPNATTAPARRIIGGRSANAEFDTDFWLDRREADRVPRDARSGTATRAILVTFVGRRAKPDRNRDGSPALPLIVVDRLLTWRELGTIETLIDCRAFPRAADSGMPCAPGTEPPAG